MENTLATFKFRRFCKHLSDLLPTSCPHTRCVSKQSELVQLCLGIRLCRFASQHWLEAEKCGKRRVFLKQMW